MANVPISNLTTTWNNVATTFTGVKLNVTDTASAAGSLLMDLQVGGVSKFKVPKNGNPVFVVPTSGFVEVNGNGDGLRTVNGSAISSYGPYGIRMGASNTLSWGSTADGPASADTVLARDAANTLAQRNGVNAQTFRLYNTFTDASNYERGKFEWATNVLRIGTEKAGTGTARALQFQTDGTTRLTIASDGGRIGIGTVPGSAGVSINCDGAINCSNGFTTLGAVTFNGQTSAFFSSARNVVIRAAGTYQIVMDTLPTTNPAVAGALWNNAGVLSVSAG